jgi:hypothetical protein
MSEQPGTQKFVNVADLTQGEKTLINFEPGEVVRVKGYKFKVQSIVLSPGELLLIPVEG